MATCMKHVGQVARLDCWNNNAYYVIPVTKMLKTNVGSLENLQGSNAFWFLMSFSRSTNILQMDTMQLEKHWPNGQVSRLFFFLH